ncbi:PAS domain-containing protein [Kordiimonas aestuarii]|uniref:PAS domain-containing protein n=1 Tax=Kordiimonas aestuarii TaxID=1005925 RepID=UPI0021CE2B96|nr:PAS domain-containing protein [Kordiimonas aestuarii]
MSSFGSDVSDKIRHSLAGFNIEAISEGGATNLSENAAWLLDYAAGKKAPEQKYPRRSDFNPVEMKHILPHVLILEPQMSMTNKILDIKVRLMGTAVSWFYGEAGGSTVRDFADSMASQRAFELVQYSFGCEEAVVGSSFKLNHSLPYHQVTVLLIPLAEDGQNISHFFVHVHITPED